MSKVQLIVAATKTTAARAVAQSALRKKEQQKIKDATLVSQSALRQRHEIPKAEREEGNRSEAHFADATREVRGARCAV